MTWSEQVAAIHAGSSRLAVADTNGPVSGRELFGRARTAADFLTDLDGARGCAVPALVTTNADALALLLGGAVADRPLAPLGPRLTVAELATMVHDTGSRVLLTEPDFHDTAKAIGAATGARVITVPALPASAEPLPAPRGEMAFYLHTSGTTGVPKRVPFTQSVMAARTQVLSGLAGFGPDDRYATGSPLHHLGGLGNITAALSAGSAVLPTTRFSIEWWRGLRALGATKCLLVPTMIEMLLTADLLDAVPLRTLLYGAAPMSPDTLRRVLTVLPDVALVNLFGQTEGSPITSLDSDDHRRAAAGATELLETVGRPVQGLRLRLDQSDGASAGEVLAAAPHLSVHGSDGWLHTGDLGSVDADGYLHLVGRRHDMVVRGGENVYPLEVENALASHPQVAAAGVVGVPDPRLGENLAAFLVPVDPGSPPDFDQLRAFTRARLAGFKVPAHWQIVSELPLTHNGKLNRLVLQENWDST
jgi:acyl-CoA synthetase (AMP-forming)/AMP-acid ligase II